VGLAPTRLSDEYAWIKRAASDTGRPGKPGSYRDTAWHTISSSRISRLKRASRARLGLLAQIELNHQIFRGCTQHGVV